MQITPLPTPLRLGTDLISIPRIHALLHPSRRHTTPHNGSETRRKEAGGEPLGRTERFLRRLLTPRERVAFGVVVLGVDGGKEKVGERCARWLAGRYVVVLFSSVGVDSHLRCGLACHYRRLKVKVTGKGIGERSGMVYDNVERARYCVSLDYVYCVPLKSTQHNTTPPLNYTILYNPQPTH